MVCSLRLPLHHDFTALNRPTGTCSNPIGFADDVNASIGDSLRVKKVSAGTTTVYIFSGTNVIAEYSGTSSPYPLAREYIYSGGQLLATIEGGATKYHHTDHLSVRLSTDVAGAKIGEQGHYPYGEVWYASGSVTKWKFTTYERDAESGNDYAIFRYAVTRLGRFSSPDLLAGTIIDPQSLNRFAYTLNDPGNLVDPLGLTYRNPMLLPAIDLSEWRTWLFEIFLLAADRNSDLTVSDGTTVWNGEEWVDVNSPGSVFGPIGPSDPTDPGDPPGGDRTPRIDPVRDRLGLCVKGIYSVDLQKFVPSAPGQNGNFVGRNSNGVFNVENDVRSYTKMGLALKARSIPGIFAGGVAGLTLASNPYVNYTASNLEPHLFLTNQLHELGHSLDLIKMGFSSESLAESLSDCIYELNEFAPKKK